MNSVSVFSAKIKSSGLYSFVDKNILAVIKYLVANLHDGLIMLS